jgi:hypothetical protein
MANITSAVFLRSGKFTESSINATTAQKNQKKRRFINTFFTNVELQFFVKSG